MYVPEIFEHSRISMVKIIKVFEKKKSFNDIEVVE